MLSDDSILLFRIINPSWIQEGELTSMAFIPSAGRPLSMFDGSMISPTDAMNRFIEDGHQAYGVVGITVGEAKSVGLKVIEDRQPYEEHISLAFPECSKKQAKEMSRHLKTMAVERGWLCLAKNRPM